MLTIRRMDRTRFVLNFLDSGKDEKEMQYLAGIDDTDMRYYNHE